MSWDIFLQGFRDGDRADGDGQAALAVLEPFIAQREDTWALLTFPDGGADVYGVDDPDTGFMFNHVGGRAAWDVIYQVARTAGFVVMPVGCVTLLADESLREHLPAEIPVPVKIVRSGSDILAAIETAD